MLLQVEQQVEQVPFHARRAIEVSRAVGPPVETGGQSGQVGEGRQWGEGRGCWRVCYGGREGA